MAISVLVIQVWTLVVLGSQRTYFCRLRFCVVWLLCCLSVFQHDSCPVQLPGNVLACRTALLADIGTLHFRKQKPPNQTSSCGTASRKDKQCAKHGFLGLLSLLGIHNGIESFISSPRLVGGGNNQLSVHACHTTGKSVSMFALTCR